MTDTGLPVMIMFVKRTHILVPLTIALSLLFGSTAYASTSGSTPDPDLTVVNPTGGTSVKDGSTPPDTVQYNTRYATCGASVGNTHVSMKAEVRDYGRYGVIQWIKVRGGENAMADLGYPNLRVWVYSASGSELRDIQTVIRPDVWWSAGAPAGSVGDGGYIKTTATFKAGTSSEVSVSCVRGTAF